MKATLEAGQSHPKDGARVEPDDLWLKQVDWVKLK